MRTERWTKRAFSDYLLLVAYLEEQFGESHADLFMERVSATVEIIKRQPYIFAASYHRKGIRRAIVSEYTSLYYRVSRTQIQIIYLSDNRRNSV